MLRAEQGKDLTRCARGARSWWLLAAMGVLALAAGCRNPAPGIGPKAPPPQAEDQGTPAASSKGEDGSKPVDRPDPTTPVGAP